MGIMETLCYIVMVLSAAQFVIALTNTRELTHMEMIKLLQSKFRVPIGYSGHEVGLAPTYAAAVIGATVLERMEPLIPMLLIDRLKRRNQ